MNINFIKRSLVWVSASLLLGCRDQIQHGLDERQANQLQMLLLDHGFDVNKVPEKGKKPSFAIEVDESQSSEAIRLLAELDLPRIKQDGFAEVFGKGSLIPTQTEERALYLQALSGEIARTLESVQDVVSARVHLVVPGPQRFNQLPEIAKASVLLRVRPHASARVVPLEDSLRRSVASSVEGLSPERVHILVSEIVTAVPAPMVHSRPILMMGGGILTFCLGAVVTGLGVLTVAWRSKWSISKPVIQSVVR